jgi:hypothetical protein
MAHHLPHHGGHRAKKRSAPRTTIRKASPHAPQLSHAKGSPDLPCSNLNDLTPTSPTAPPPPQGPLTGDAGATGKGALLRHGHRKRNVHPGCAKVTPSSDGAARRVAGRGRRRWLGFGAPESPREGQCRGRKRSCNWVPSLSLWIF